MVLLRVMSSHLITMHVTKYEFSEFHVTPYDILWALANMKINTNNENKTATANVLADAAAHADADQNEDDDED